MNPVTPKTPMDKKVERARLYYAGVCYGLGLSARQTDVFLEIIEQHVRDGELAVRT